MKRFLPMLLALAAVAPVTAEADVAAVALARFGAEECINIAGYEAAGRRNWTLSAYWENSPDPSVAGVCAEEAPHRHLAVQCAQIAHTFDPYGPLVTSLHIYAIDGSAKFLAVLSDGGDHDWAGVQRVFTAPGPNAPLCGASEVTTSPVTEGSIVLVG